MLEPGTSPALSDDGMRFEPNERSLLVRLLKRFGASVAKDAAYDPNDISYPMMLTITNQVLCKFGEPAVEPQVKP